MLIATWLTRTNSDYVHTYRLLVHLVLGGGFAPIMFNTMMLVSTVLALRRATTTRSRLTNSDTLQKVGRQPPS